MTNSVIEVVTFKLAENVSETQFLDSARAVNAFLDASEGFVRRHLSVAENGVWTEHIEWQSMEQAKSASEKLMQFEAAGPFMAAIDVESVAMGHNALKMSHA
ncbi:MAG: hypothetical protein ABJM29_01155 [Rhizobiaceae bacterium]